MAPTSTSSSSSSSLALFPAKLVFRRGVETSKAKFLNPCLKPSTLCLSISVPVQNWKRASFKIWASVSMSSPDVGTSPADLVDSIISKVAQSDRGVLLTKDEHKEVAEMAKELQKYCVDEPVKCPLIFGDWDVLYCSNPTSPGGGYRSAVGRLFFKTKEMIQVVEAPDSVKNRVSFSVFGLLDGQVSLKGKLRVVDEDWIQVIFEAPELKVGPFEFRYGGVSEVKLQITYIDEKIRLGMGWRGSLFVFRRRISFV